MTFEPNKYNRLVVFGSSDTYGAHLPDCNPDTQTEVKPSINSWPYILGEKLFKPVKNLATPGASNREILLSILTSEICETDLVLVCWTFVNRTYIVDDENSLVRIYPHLKTQEAEQFYRLYDINNLVYNTLLDISHANLFFLNKKCNVYNLYTDPLMSAYINPVPIQEPLIYLNKVPLTIDRATDNKHPGLKSHTNIANYVHKILNG